MKERVLVIDDDEGVRLTIQYILSMAGHDVRSVCDGEQGIGAFRSFAPDVVITDLIMPGQQGIEIIAAFKKERPEIKIIAMSGGARPRPGNILQSARAAGADDILAKPFEMTLLTDVVRGVLQPRLPSADVLRRSVSP